MKKIILLTLLLIGIVHATEYQIVHLKKGGTLNVREVPVVTSRTTVGRIPAYATGIKIQRCKYNRDGNKWCYISYPMGGSHIEGWVNRRFLAPVKSNTYSKRRIQNFLQNFYMADEEDFLDKLQVFYKFPMQQYLWKKNVSFLQLRSKKVRFYKKWGKRDYRMTYMKILKRRHNYIDVQTTVRWKIKGRKDFEEGKDVQKVRLVPSRNTFQVLAIKNLSHYVKPKPKVEEEKESNETVLEERVVPTLVKNIPKKGKIQYYIQVASFFKPINPSYLKNITKNGFAYVVQKVQPTEKTTIRRVLVGPFETTQKAQASLGKVRALISKNAYLKTLSL